jgi:hypothetical protein
MSPLRARMNRGHDPGWIGRRDAENLHPIGAPVGCALPALGGSAQRGRGAGLPAAKACTAIVITESYVRSVAVRWTP